MPRVRRLRMGSLLPGCRGGASCGWLLVPYHRSLRTCPNLRAVPCPGALDGILGPDEGAVRGRVRPERGQGLRVREAGRPHDRACAGGRGRRQEGLAGGLRHGRRAAATALKELSRCVGRVQRRPYRFEVLTLSAATLRITRPCGPMGLVYSWPLYLSESSSMCCRAGSPPMVSTTCPRTSAQS